MKFFRGEIVANHPKFPEDSAAATPSSDMPVGMAAPEIIYTKEDDEAIDQFHRERGERFIHSISSY